MAIIKEPFLSVVRRAGENYKPGLFKIVSPLVFTWEEKKAVITIGAGSYTNFASIPLGLRNIYSINGDHRLAAIIHDYLYERLGTVLAEQVFNENGDIITPESPRIIRYSRREADEFFYKTMLEEGVPKWKAASMFRAVRLFGFLYAKEWQPCVN